MSDTIQKYIKDPGSAITHFIGMLMAIFAAIPLLIKAAREPSRIYIISIAIYAVSLILLYAASTTYHTFNRTPRINKILKKIDHMMISILIAGSYTPICLLVLGGKTGIILLSIVWVLRSPESSSRLSGSTARSGYLPFCISAWAGPAYLHLHNFLTPCHRQLSDGSLQVVSFTLSAA